MISQYLIINNIVAFNKKKKKFTDIKIVKIIFS